MVFSAAHFITFDLASEAEVCESLHGHNYGVRVEIEGPLNHQAYVVDFIALRDQMMRLTSKLDHKMLLPQRHPSIAVSKEGEEIVARYRDRRWIFPEDNCVLLPIANTTAELLAHYLGDQLLDWLKDEQRCQVNRITVSIDENHGQWGIWEWQAANGPDREY